MYKPLKLMKRKTKLRNDDDMRTQKEKWMLCWICKMLRLLVQKKTNAAVQSILNKLSKSVFSWRAKYINETIGMNHIPMTITPSTHKDINKYFGLFCLDGWKGRKKEKKKERNKDRKQMREICREKIRIKWFNDRVILLLRSSICNSYLRKEWKSVISKFIFASNFYKDAAGLLTFITAKIANKRMAMNIAKNKRK